MQKGRLQLQGQSAHEVTTTAYDEGKQSVSCGFAYVISRAKQKAHASFAISVCARVHTQSAENQVLEVSVLVE